MKTDDERMAEWKAWCEAHPVPKVYKLNAGLQLTYEPDATGSVTCTRCGWSMPWAADNAREARITANVHASICSPTPAPRGETHLNWPPVGPSDSATTPAEQASGGSDGLL